MLPADDTLVYGQNAGPLSDILRKLHELTDATRRQELPNPTLIRLNPGVIFQSTVRYRGVWLILSSSIANDVLRLLLGTSGVFDTIVAAGTVYVPMPIVFDAGIDLSVVNLTNPNETTWRAYLVAYTETDD